jgi:type IV pilus assembly protein PilA
LNGRAAALFAVVGIPALIYLSAPLGERTAYGSRRYAQETAALKALQTFNTAQVQYNSQFGRYARSLDELGPSASNLISADLAMGENHGYNFTLTGTPTGYAISAVPAVFGSTGSRTFFSDQSLVVRENYGQEPATLNSKEVGSVAAKAETTKQAERRRAMK